MRAITMDPPPPPFYHMAWILIRALPCCSLCMSVELTVLLTSFSSQRKFFSAPLSNLKPHSILWERQRIYFFRHFEYDELEAENMQECFSEAETVSSSEQALLTSLPVRAKPSLWFSAVTVHP